MTGPARSPGPPPCGSSEPAFPGVPGRDYPRQSRTPRRCAFCTDRGAPLSSAPHPQGEVGHVVQSGGAATGGARHCRLVLADVPIGATDGVLAIASRTRGLSAVRGARRPSAAVGTQASAPRSTSLSLRMGQGVTRCCFFGRAAASNRSVSRCVHLDEVVELRISGSLCSDHSVVSRRQSSQQFVELALGHHLLAMLGVLNREHHDDGHCRRG